MTTNQYINLETYTQEQNLLSDLMSEAIQIHGVNMFYIPRVLRDEDYLFGEDVNSKFNKKYELEMYIESFEGFQGNRDFFTKFGLEMQDRLTLRISKPRFAAEVTSNEPSILYPRAGDLIYYPTASHLFEIKFVEGEAPFYQLGDNYSYRLQCEAFIYNQEEVDVAIDEIDELVEDLFNDGDVIADDINANNPDVLEDLQNKTNYSESNPFGTF